VTTELEEGEWFEIVGVVGDVQHYELGKSPEPRMYFPCAQYPTEAMGWVVRSQVDVASVAPLIREAVWEVDPAQPLTSVRDLEESLIRTVAVPRATMIMTGLFAAVALVLAIVGIYGVLSYAVSRRTREIGIRMALGARRADILRDVIAYGSALTVIGVVLGLAVSFSVSRLLTGLLYEVRPTDPMVFVAVPLILMAVALLACYIPASRASKINPTTMLHYE
jgi:putative ABC transport system permease protein